MTLIQKQNIVTMRGVGDSYAKIAAALEISENTVKSYCQRNKLGGGPGANAINSGVKPVKSAKTAKTASAAPAFNASQCKQCGAKLKQQKGKKTRKFCSTACCDTWWNAHPEAVQQKAVYNFTCPHCGAAFSAYGNAKRKFCSHACYILARFKNAESGVKGGECA